MSEKTLIHVEGMTCANCANTITKTLEKEGLKNVNVNYLTTEVSFEEIDSTRLEKVKSRIGSIGYKVVAEKIHEGERAHDHEHTADHSHHGHSHSSKVTTKFLLSAVFTAPLLLHMFFSLVMLHDPYFQLALCIPVMYIGISFFGKSAWGSVKAGAMNMDVLVFIGSTAAFVYSLAGMCLHRGAPNVHEYLYFETAGSIITFVLLGNVLEQRSVKQTTSAIHELSKLQPQHAKKVISENGKEIFSEIAYSEIRKGDELFAGSGDKIPADGIIVSGTATINESMITGESHPVTRTINDKVTGGTIVEDGTVKLKATAIGNETTLARIIRMVSDAQLSKPEIQRLGDQVSNIFVPAVLIISVLTFVITYFFMDVLLRDSIMRSIAVLVISCPCAMGLATPTALMVGIGRAARNGILIKGGSTVERFSKIKTVVFDKTGTLTTGKFRISSIRTFNISENEVRTILYALEQHSSHPIARSILKECESFSKAAAGLTWKSVSEDKGKGINATDVNGNLYSAGSYIMARHATADDKHAVYLLVNNKLVATVDLEDEIKPGARETIDYLRSLGIKTILMSGDRKEICEEVGRELGVDEIYWEQLPEEKLEMISSFSQKNITAMVGDGINDAPALVKADVGVSLSDASQVAIQSAQVVLLKSNDLRSLRSALQFSRHTLLTIKQNLFWAFAYNVVAIPIAAAGLLSPAVGALSMAFSDVVLILNSVRLRFKKIS